MKTPFVEESQRVFIVWNDAKSVSLEKCTEKCYLIFSGNNPTKGKAAVAYTAAFLMSS